MTVEEADKLKLKPRLNDQFRWTFAVFRVILDYGEELVEALADMAESQPSNLEEMDIMDARILTWRSQWDEVSPFIESTSLLQRSQTLKGPEEKWGYSCMLAVSVYTTWGYEHEGMEFVRALWSDAVHFFEGNLPTFLPKLRDLWQESVYISCECHGHSDFPSERSRSPSPFACCPRRSQQMHEDCVGSSGIPSGCRTRRRSCLIA